MTIREIQRKLVIIKLRIEKAVTELQNKEFKKTIPNLPPPRFIIIHHGAGPLNFAEVNNYHKQKWGFKSSLGFYCGYQYFIEYPGWLYQARRDTEEGAHTVGNTPRYYNRCSVGVCLQGNTEIKESTKYQLDTLKNLIDRLKIEYNIPNNRVLFHGEIQNTLCCGQNLIKWLVQNYPNYKGRSVAVNKKFDSPT